MRARKVAINYDSNSTPERFYTARKAQAVADECNIPGETYQIIVGCLRPKYYVLLIDDGETVKYYSALSETWIPVCAEEENGKKDVLDAEELEVAEGVAVAQVECKDQGEDGSMNEAKSVAGEKQINAADAIVMDFLWNLAIKEGYEVPYRWKEYGCLKHRKADKGRIVFVFEGPRELPDVRTERGEYCFGGYGAGRKTDSIIDRLHQLFNLRVERGYKVPADGPDGFKYQCSSWGPVLSMDMDEMLLICQQQEVVVNDEITPEAIKHAAKSLLDRGHIEADGSELARACTELHARGLCEFRPAAGIGRFGYWPSTRTQEVLS